MSIVEVERVEILPLNPPANNSYSFKQGFPIVQFMIPNQPKLLVGSTVRLNGTIRLNMPVSTEQLPELVDNNQNKGGADASRNGCLSSRVGVASTIEQITLSSMTNQTLEVVRSYGRYLASVQSVTHSQDDFDTNVQLESLTASRKMNGAFLVNNQVSFSIPLRSGLLSGGMEIPIGTNGIRGMMVELRLAPDAQVFSGFSLVDGTSKNDAGSGTGMFYQLRDLSLSYNLLVPDAETSAKMSVPSTGSMTYNSISHLYSVINASDQTQNFNLGTSKTLSVFHNFLPTPHLNNYNEDSFETPRLKNVSGGKYSAEAPIKRVSFLKGGVLSPIENEVDVETASINSRPRSEMEVNFINSIKPYSMFNHSLISPNTQNQISTDVSPLTGKDLIITGGQNRQQADPSPVFGVGVAEDPYKVGVDFKNTNYGVRIVSDLDGQSPNSIFSYVLAQNTLAYSPQGIAIVS
jgi:hypothetical protein